MDGRTSAGTDLELSLDLDLPLDIEADAASIIAAVEAPPSALRSRPTRR